jgi:iron complex outermembrane recepter protein
VHRYAAVPVLLFALLSPAAQAASDNAQAASGFRPEELKRLSVEDLLNLEVTTLSRKEERLSRAPAAVYVITGEEIRRSGATSIPEALRLAPGVEVARINAHTWAISIRGFNSNTANKLLVLIDGRSVYTPLYSGVFWDAQDVLLEDVDRIEVIAGPGGTLWGANAVNGVINIITKSAADTRGGVAEAGGGNRERAFGGFRYGGRVGGNGFARAYLKGFDRAASRFPDGSAAYDDWHQQQGGFRFDWGAGTDAVTLQGDLYDGREGSQFTEFSLASPADSELRQADSHQAGGNLLGRWTRALEGGSQLQLQAYYDRTERRIAGTLREDRDTVDLDFQQHLAGHRQDLVWGLGYRGTRDALENSLFVAFLPAHRSDQLASAFLQDEVTLPDDRFHLTLGSKVEHNDYTGFEVQPSVRFAFLVDDRRTLWAAVSRAVRTPSRLESDLVLTSPIAIPGVPLPVVVEVRGDRDVVAEELIAWEAGARTEVGGHASLDLALFYNEYERLQSLEADTPVVVPDPASPYILLPNHLANGVEGETSGGTLTAAWQARPGWRLRFSYTRLDLHLRSEPTSLDTSTAASIEGSSPQNQAALHSSLDLPLHLQLFTGVRYVDRLPAQGVDRHVPVDLSIGWRPRVDVEVSIACRDLFGHRHSEFTAGSPLEVDRSVWSSVSWRF